MPKNRMEDLRNHLFETLKALRDKDNPMDIERAKAVAEVAGVIVKSAAVEVAFVKATGRDPQSELMSGIQPVGIEAGHPAETTRVNGNGKSSSGSKPAETAPAANKSNSGSFRCEECPATFENARELGSHKTMNHFGESSLTRSQLAGA